MITLVELRHVVPQQHVLVDGDGKLWTILGKIDPPKHGLATFLVEDPSGTETYIHYDVSLGFIDDLDLAIIYSLNQDSAAVKHISEISAAVR